LTVNQNLRGAMDHVSDGLFGCGGDSDADITGVTGSFTGGSLTSGSLNIADPGTINNGSPATIPFNSTASATIEGTSSGSPISTT